MAGKAVAVDPGSFAWKVLAIRAGKTGISVTRFGALRTGKGAPDLGELGIPLAGAVVGLAGRDMTLRYTQVPPSPDWQLRNLMDLEIQDIAGQSGDELSADYNLLPGTGEDADMDTILLALARNESLERVASVVRDAQGSVSAHVPNCIALYNAYLRTAVIEDEDEVVCLANIGHETTDIALVRGHDLLVARNLSGGAKVIDDAIANQFNVSPRKAESLKRDLLDLDPQSRGRYASGQAEKITMAGGGAASMFASGIQSSVAFCQAQTKIEGLRLDRVLLCGGGARLRGVRGMLREALHCPVELFDPFETVDLSALPEADAEQLREMRLEAVIALGLAVGRVDEQAYSLEILPEAVKRRQRFLQRTIYNIGAAVVGVALLALTAATGKTALENAESDYRKLLAQKRKYESVDRATEELIAQNQRDSAVAQELTHRALPLNGVLRALRAVHQTLPPEAWLTKLEVDRPRSTGRTGVSHPVVVLEGSVRPIHGADVGDVYAKFDQAFRAHPLIAGSKIARTSENDPLEGTKNFSFKIDFLPDPTPEADSEDN